MLNPTTTFTTPSFRRKPESSPNNLEDDCYCTVVFSRFSAIGERLSPLFLKRMTAMAHKLAAVIENVIPTICMDPVVTLSSLAEIFKNDLVSSYLILNRLEKYFMGLICIRSTIVPAAYSLFIRRCLYLLFHFSRNFIRSV